MIPPRRTRGNQDPRMYQTQQGSLDERRFFGRSKVLRTQQDFPDATRSPDTVRFSRYSKVLQTQPDTIVE